MERMNYRIKPDENEFRKARETVENELKTVKDSIEVDDFEVILGWQDFGRSTTFQVTDNGIFLIMDPDYGWEGEIRKSLVRGLLELEFIENSEHDDIEFHWQDIAMMSYVKARSAEFLEEENSKVDIDVESAEIISELSREDSEFSDVLYENAGKLATLIGRRTAKEDRTDELLVMRKKEVEKLVEEVI